MQNNKSKHFKSIQYSRGLAAFAVVIAHTLEHPNLEKIDSHYITGRLGVEIFFIVSGFIIANVCGNNSFSIGKFLARRFFRVAPLYWLITSLVALICLFAPQVLKTTKFTIEHFLLSLLFIPHLNPIDLTDRMPLLKLGWTLNYEMFFYIIIGALFFLKSALARAVTITIVFSLLYFSRNFLEIDSEVYRTYTDIALFPFLIGIWLSYFEANGIFQKLPKTSPFFILLITTIAAIFLYQQPFKSIFTFPNYLLMAATAFGLIFGLLALEINQKLPNSNLLEKIGDSSYSLYLIHMFVVGAAWHFGKKLLPSSEIIHSYAMPIAITTSSLIAGYLTYLIIEKPLLRWTQRISN